MTNGGCTVWLTGLPSSGKTTIAEHLRRRLEADGRAVELLDGDEIRKYFSAGVGFSREDRTLHLQRVAHLCALLTKHGVAVIASFVSPYRENRDYVRRLIGERFLEVYVDTSLEECIRRDVKGLYKKAIAGEVRQFTGISDPYEPPFNPEVVVKTLDEPADAAAQRILETMDGRRLVSE